MHGKLVIVSGPSGTGKTTVVHSLLETYPELTFSVSATTREPRGKEVEGQDYYFLEKEDFKKKIESKAFLEYEEVYDGLFYGTLMSEIERIWENKQIPVLDIDVKGALNIKNNFSGDPLLIYIHPGSKENLRLRLESRATEAKEKIEKRLKRADEELALAEEFDHVIFNHKLEDTLYKVKVIVQEYLTLAKEGKNQTN